MGRGRVRLARTTGARTSRSLNHHGQLTGFPQPTPRSSQTPKEPSARLIFIPWRDAMCSTVFTPYPRYHQLQPLSSYRERGVQELISVSLPISPLRCHRILRIRRRVGRTKLCYASLHFLSSPSPPFTPPWLCRSC